MSGPTMRFDDDVVIVTGAGRGLGREQALMFAAHGAKVLVNDRDADVAAEVVEDIHQAGGQAALSTDSVTSAAGARAIVDAAVEAFGKVTILVNNAGVITYGAFGDLTEDQWRQMTAVTLDGAFFMCKAVWPLFSRARYGRIVNTTSNAGFAGNEQLVHYGAAKLGVAGLTKALAHEARPLGVRVNAIAPMAVTRMNREAFFGGAEPGEDWQADIRSGVAPMGPPAAVAPTVLWLAHRSTEVNGQIFSTSSGKVARVAVVLGQGYFDADHSAADLRDHVSQISELGDYFEPADCADELRLIPELFKST